MKHYQTAKAKYCIPLMYRQAHALGGRRQAISKYSREIENEIIVPDRWLRHFAINVFRTSAIFGGGEKWQRARNAVWRMRIYNFPVSYVIASKIISHVPKCFFSSKCMQQYFYSGRNIVLKKHSKGKTKSSSSYQKRNNMKSMPESPAEITYITILAGSQHGHR